MATLDWQLTRTEGITLVELLVTSETDRRVRIESALEPVWPPRSRGLPAAGWEDGAFEARIEAGERLVVGYASPAQPVEPPAKLRSPTTDDADGVSARELVRALGDAKPPRDAVPAGTAPTRTDERDGTTDRRETGTGRRQGRTEPDRTDELPPMFESWLGAVESRLAAAERPPPGGADGHDGPTSPGGPRALDRQLAADRDRLETLARRSQRLVDRLDALRETGEHTPTAGESA